ncbi:hypothetical protein K432DRAFT_219694 [Lepidopterella palustris CBS 459.81]|uniref:Uncharacterized protein n=1 Tax=Lepidopterella palustris CBS 459.81 TaxID=1314670 RepID=A0A8E2EEX5_9PEZI|nr:hypothetical protein K432DRAFT_219694 [Lepidopterella palustris CBS 459.81]
MPVLTRQDHASRLSARLNSDIPTLLLSSPVIRNLIICTSIFFVALMILIAYLLCFYREREEICWPCRCCCRCKKTNPKRKKSRLGSRDYALSADARNASARSVHAPARTADAAAVLGISRPESYGSRRVLIRIPPPQQQPGRDSVVLDDQFVIGEEDQEYEMGYFSPNKEKPKQTHPLPLPRRSENDQVTATGPTKGRLHKQRRRSSELYFGFRCDDEDPFRDGSV